MLNTGLTDAVLHVSTKTIKSNVCQDELTFGFVILTPAEKVSDRSEK